MTINDDDDDDASWKRYIVYLALDEVRRNSASNPLQFQSFIGVVYNGKKPRELADLLGIDSLQISENVRAIKDKIKTALRHLDDKYPINDLDSVDWNQLKKDAETAQQEIVALADWFQQKNI